MANTAPEEQEVFRQYAGSQSCRECHGDLFTKWVVSNHGQAERPLGPGDDKAFVPTRSFNHGSQHTEIRVSGGQREVVALGLSKQYEPHPVVRVIGNQPLRQFLVAAPGGRLQTLEASYDPLRDQWFNVFGNEDRFPGEWGHWSGRGMTWNVMCASCHNTRVRKNYDESSDSYATSMAEPTVSCEACHGPMKAHVDWRHAHPNSKASDPTIQKLSNEQVFETCATCHSRRGELTGDFAPGNSFQDHFLLSIVDRSDLFYPDGQIRDEDYEYSAFLGSKMHAAGVRCINCHDPHTAKVRLPGNLMCMSCHSGGFQNAPKIDPATHSFHKIDPLYAKADLGALARRDPSEVAKNGGECVNCHMPQTFYMQRHRRHDHGFTIPDPLLTQKYGIPNACNRCHTDKDTSWALKWSNQWYGAKLDRPSRARAEALAEGRAGKPGSAERLVAILSGTDGSYWKASAASMLADALDQPSVLNSLIAATKDPSPLVRSNVASSLATGIDQPEVGAALKALLNDPFRSVRYNAAWALRATLDPHSYAGKELARILDFSADQPLGQMQRGAFYAARNDPQQAVAHYEKAVQWDPNSAPIRHDFAVVLSGLNRNQEAIEQLQAACRLEPRNADFRYNLALAFNEAGDSGKALENLQETVRIDPTHASGWYNLGLALNQAGKPEEALRALSSGEQAAPNDPRIPFARATILARAGRYIESQAAARQALKIAPSYAPAEQLLKALNNSPEPAP